MALNNIKNIRKDSGFTIVELLIVIVVIAILATISIVAYSGIQTRAKATKAQSNRASVQKVAEAYYADNNVYPTTVAMFSNAVTKLPTTLTVLSNATPATIPTLDASNGENSILYRYVGTAPNATGACAFYWDFGAATPAVSSGVFMGTATSANCSATVGANGNTPAAT